MREMDRKNGTDRSDVLPPVTNARAEEERQNKPVRAPGYRYTPLENHGFRVNNNRAFIAPFYKLFQDVLAWKASTSEIWKESNFFAMGQTLDCGNFFAKATHDDWLMKALRERLGFCVVKKLETEYSKADAVAQEFDK